MEIYTKTKKKKQELSAVVVEYLYMKFRRYILLILFVPFCALSFGKSAESNLSLGIAKTVITPPIGTDILGFLLRKNPSEGVLDDINAKALVLSDGKMKLAIVTADILGFDGNDVQVMKREVQQKTGIKYILFSASHNHSGPAVITLHGCGEIDSTYHQEFKKKIVDTVINANALLTPVKTSYGIGYGNISMNRRSQFAKNTTFSVDSEIGILRFDGLDGNPKCILVNYACHAVTLTNNRKFSRDYPGVLQDELEKKYHCQVMFLQGAAGDINPREMGTEERMQKMGQELAGDVEKIICQPLSVSKIQVKYIPIRFPIQPLSATEIDSCLNVPISVSTSIQEKYHNAMLEWKNSISIMPKKNYLNGEIVKVELGNLVLVGIPGELFSQIGREIKSQYKPKSAFVIGYANGDVGYLPTRQAFSEGGYEVNQAYRYYGKQGPFTPDLEEIILKATRP